MGLLAGKQDSTTALRLGVCSTCLVSTAFDTLLLPFDLLAGYQARHPDKERVIVNERPKQIKAVILKRDNLYLEFDAVITKYDFTGKGILTTSNTCWRCANLADPQAHKYKIWASVSPPGESLLAEVIPFWFPAGKSSVTASFRDGRILTVSDPWVYDFIDHDKPQFAGLGFTVTLVDGSVTNKTRWQAGAREWDERLPKNK